METTHTTPAGGTKGYLKWDGTADELRIELESLLNIDAIKVSKEVLTNNNTSTNSGAGVLYHVTFVRVKNRGEIPLLQIVDIVSNGCADAHDSGGYFSQDLGDVSVHKVMNSFMPLYTMQIKDPIQFDASDLDVKAALENLSQSCVVHVSRWIFLGCNMTRKTASFTSQ